MEAFPHHYRVRATAEPEGSVSLSGKGLPPLRSDPPAEFGGPGDQWSPETLLVAAVADCFVLTFRAIARGSKLEWRSLSCETEGVLDRVDRTRRFSELIVRASLQVPPGIDPERARRLLERAEQNCLVTNSLKAEARFEGEVEVAP